MEKTKFLKLVEEERNKNKIILDNEKLKFINDLKKIKKEDLFKKEKTNLNFFDKLKIILWGK
jgi:hypothetical protein